MTKWIFEPGHSAVELSVKHMMVTWVRGHFKNVRGFVEFDPENPTQLYANVEIDAANIWTGNGPRDEHLKSSDFLDVETYPKITFQGGDMGVKEESGFKLTGDLTLHGTTKRVTLDIAYEGAWETPYWKGDRDWGPVHRVGFTGRTVINRFDFGIAWQDELAAGGLVVAPNVVLTIDVEAIRESDLNRVVQGQKAA